MLLVANALEPTACSAQGLYCAPCPHACVPAAPVAPLAEPTFGKGKIQSVFELADGSALFVTVAKYQTPGGSGERQQLGRAGLG